MAHVETELFHGRPGFRRELDLSDMIDEQISAQQVLDILASAPLLQRIGICNSSLDHHLQPSQIRLGTPILQLPNLNSIEFDDIEIKATEVILSSIRAPNCRSLTIVGSEDDEPDPSGFLGRGLGHFNDFLRGALSANDSSSIHISDGSIRWESASQSPSSPSSLEFTVELRCGAPATGVEWATGIIGLGAQEVEHNLEVLLAHDGFDEGDLAAYRSFSFCHSVTKLVLDEDHTLTRQILKLLGTWQEPEDGRDPSPGFPSLRVLVLTTSARGRWTLDDLEFLVSRRFGERGDRTIPPTPKLSIIIQALWWDYYGGPGSAPGLAQVQRLRATEGVERLTRYLNKSKSGMLAVVYEDDTEL